VLTSDEDGVIIIAPLKETDKLLLTNIQHGYEAPPFFYNGVFYIHEHSIKKVRYTQVEYKKKMFSDAIGSVIAYNGRSTV
jgi:hypothetical protein